MFARAAVLRRAIPIPPARLLPALGSSAAIDGMTGLVVLSAGNSYLLHTLGASAALPAIALTLHSAVKITASPIAGRLADRSHVAAVLPAVPILAGAGLATMLMTNSIGGYLVGLAGLTAGTATAWILLRHYIGSATTSAERGNATTWISLASGGAAAGGFGAGTLLAEITPSAAFVAALALVFIATVLLNIVRRTSDSPTRDAGQIKDGRAHVATRRFEFAVLGLIAAGQFAVSGGFLVAFWPLVLRELDLRSVEIVWPLVPAGALTLVALASVARWSRPGRRLTEVAILYAIVATGLSLTAWTRSPLTLAVAMVFVIPAIAAAMSVVTAAVLDFSRLRRGTGWALGWLGSAEATGSLAGAGLTGLIIANSGPRGALFTLSATAAGLACATGVALLAGRARPATQPSP